MPDKNAGALLAFDPRTVVEDAPPRVDCHLHTDWTDGRQSVREVYDEAVAAGLEAILYSEHARKTSTDWFADFAAEVRDLPSTPCRAFVGVEVKVETPAGELDTCDEITRHCDLVMASVHRFPDAQGESIPFQEVDPETAVELEFELAARAMANPLTDILGHPFGMCLRRYGVVPPAARMRDLIAIAAEKGVIFEINSHYHPEPRRLLEWCRELKATVSFGSNGHGPGEVGRIVRVMEGAEPAWTPCASS